jgi:hypothetical protein
MASDFYAEVEAKLGTLLQQMGFAVDGVDDGPDEGGIARHIVYYRSADCKLQIYYSAREGEMNCMIAPLHAPNEFGLNSKNWHFISRFSKRSDIPLQEQLQIALAEVQSYENRLDWVKDRIIRHYEDAHAGILEKYGSAS